MVGRVAAGESLLSRTTYCVTGNGVGAGVEAQNNNRWTHCGHEMPTRDFMSIKCIPTCTAAELVRARHATRTAH